MQWTRRLFFFGLGLTALIAVGSYWWQLPGLAGRSGIVPIGPMMERIRGAPEVSFFDVPTLLWLSSSDLMLHLCCALAFGSGALLVLGLAPRWASLVLWGSWLSLVEVGHPFLAFQWDVLLVETAFCAVLFAPAGFRPKWKGLQDPAFALRVVMLVLACKVTLESGLVKLGSGDPTWRDLTALTYHWWSQPLPTWTSVWIAQLPLVVQQLMCVVMFVLELVAPLLLLGPRKIRLTGAVGLLALQVGLFVAGNYSFYNLLAFVLAIPALDDRFLRRSGSELSPFTRGPWWTWVVLALFTGLSVATFSARSIDAVWLWKVRRWSTVNAYGAFAVMTKTRDEIILEGSADGVTWEPYELPWKPGAVDRRPDFIAPLQPRLDWQLWFAALGECQNNPWVYALQQHLVKGTPEVLALFEKVPARVPRFVRSRRFEYRFAPLEERGVWWKRSEVGIYCPTVQ